MDKLNKINISPDKAVVFMPEYDHLGDIIENIDDSRINLFMPSLIIGDLFKGNKVLRIDFNDDSWKEISARESLKTLFNKHKFDQKTCYIVFCRNGNGLSIG